nr:MAG TPA: hypothetical protein [Caudoviricetes sp.]
MVLLLLVKPQLQIQFHQLVFNGVQIQSHWQIYQRQL